MKKLIFYSPNADSSGVGVFFQFSFFVVVWFVCLFGLGFVCVCVFVVWFLKKIFTRMQKSDRVGIIPRTFRLM